MPTPLAGTGTITDAANAIAALLDPTEPETEQAAAPEGTEDAAPDAETETPEPEAEQATPEEEQDEDAEPAPVAATISDDAEITVKVDGEELKVPVKELKAGYSRQKDYTIKTQELAKQREATKAELTAAQAERESLQAALTQLKANLDQQAPTRPDPAMYQTDPTEFAYQSEMYRRHQEQQAQIAAAQQELSARTAADQRKALEAYVAEEQAKLIEKLPDWKDAKKAQAEQAVIASYAKEMGYTDADLANVTDHRAVAVLRDAARYRELMAKHKDPIPVPTKPTTPTLKPAAAQPEGKQRGAKAAVERLRSTGKLNDAANAISRLGLL